MRDPLNLKANKAMPKFRKKPVEIEAIQYKGYDINPIEVQVFIGDGSWNWRWPSGGTKPELYIQTLEGELHVSPNDWIIKGVKAEFYPCKPDIFNATYDPVVP